MNNVIGHYDALMMIYFMLIHRRYVMSDVRDNYVMEILIKVEMKKLECGSRWME